MRTIFLYFSGYNDLMNGVYNIQMMVTLEQFF